MNTCYWNCLSWNKLTSPEMIDKDILIIYRGPDFDDIHLAPQKVVQIIGTDHVENEHVLIVYDHDEDDIFLITREGKGRLWETYQIMEGF